MPTTPSKPRRLKFLTLAAAAAVLCGCAAQRVHEDGMKLIAEGKPEQALPVLHKASTMEPSNARYRIDYLAQRALLAQERNARADAARNAGRLDEAVRDYQLVLRDDAANDRAARGLQLVQDQRRADAAAQEVEQALKAGKLELAQDIARRAAKELPQNERAQKVLLAVDERVENERIARERKLAAQTVFRRPVTLQFRDANLKMVFEALSRTAGVNIILDRDVKSDLKTTIYVKDASVEDTIDLILMQNQLEKRVLNQNTMFVYPAVAAKQKEYSELKVKSFQLGNVDAAHVANIIKSMLKTKDIVTDARTNTLVMRDTPDAIAVAEKLVAANDVPDPEVMLEVEVLEVSADRLSNLGIKWPESFGISTPSSAKTVGDLKNLTRNDLVVTPLGVAINLMMQDTSTNILASPRIRARNKEKARILVGDKVPVITNLLTPQQAGQTSVITGSIQYVDVGIKLEVEPQVYADGDVGIKINLEVSSIGKTIETASGVAYQIGTRSAQTSLRLKDGETQVLAGLINDQERDTSSKVPGLGQVPVAGRLFSSNNGNASKSEIVLSITPHIVRPQILPEARVGDVWSGTEANVRDRPLRLDPIGAAQLGADAQMPALSRGSAQANAASGQHAPAPSPEEQPKAGGAGGSRLLDPDRFGVAPAAGTATVGKGGAPASTATANAGATVAAPGLGTGTAPSQPRQPAPPSIQPGRAMRPSTPSSPAGTAPTVIPPAATDGG